MLRCGGGTVIEIALGRMWVDCSGEIYVAESTRDAYRGDHPQTFDQSYTPSYALWRCHLLVVIRLTHIQ